MTEAGPTASQASVRSVRRFLRDALERRNTMTTESTSNMQYSWSLDLRELLNLDDFTISWLTMTTDLVIRTGIGSTNCVREGPTTIHFIEVPIAYLVDNATEPDFVVLELTQIDDVTLSHLRPAWAGAEAVRDIAMAQVES